MMFGFLSGLIADDSVHRKRRLEKWNYRIFVFILNLKMQHVVQIAIYQTEVLTCLLNSLTVCYRNHKYFHLTDVHVSPMQTSLDFVVYSLQSPPPPLVWPLLALNLRLHLALCYRSHSTCNEKNNNIFD